MNIRRNSGWLSACGDRPFTPDELAEMLRGAPSDPGAGQDGIAPGGGGVPSGGTGEVEHASNSPEIISGDADTVANWSRLQKIAAEIPAHDVANPSHLTNPNSYRVQVWRAANRERYNERQRELMRKRRAAKKPLGIPHG